jgi:hypothetical protein
MSNYTTLSAAQKRRDRELAEMRRTCGQNAWDDHYYVFPLTETKMQMEVECPICERAHVVRYTWQPGEFDPGNEMDNECPECKALPAGKVGSQ